MDLINAQATKVGAPIPISWRTRRSEINASHNSRIFLAICVALSHVTSWRSLRRPDWAQHIMDFINVQATMMVYSYPDFLEQTRRSAST